MIFSRKRQALSPANKKIIRGKLRMLLGSKYFQLKRLFAWMIHWKDFARTQIKDTEINSEFPEVIAAHQSIIYRRLAGVDMSLQENKKVNLGIAIEKLNGLILYPGQVFSFWFLVGKPTKAKGYLPGVQLQGGQFLARTGGGLCQLGNLLYWMTLHTPLLVTERWRHSFDVFPDTNRTLPFGSGATLAYNYIDLQIKNTTTVPYLLHLWLDEKYLHGEWRSIVPIPHSYKVFETNHQFYAEPYGGYTRRNRIQRITTDKITEQLISQETITENLAWVMYEPLLEN